MDDAFICSLSLCNDRNTIVVEQQEAARPAVDMVVFFICSSLFQEPPLVLSARDLIVAVVAGPIPLQMLRVLKLTALARACQGSRVLIHFCIPEPEG